jgi:hypothetical protein
MHPEPIGWAWFMPGASADDTAHDAVAQAASRCFRGEDGRRVLAHLCALTIQRRLPAECSEAMLRHLEGQRHLVAYLDALIQQGCRLPASPTMKDTP